jgi:hypothetical protein
MKIMNGLDLQSQKIISLADPSASTDAANKQYVDNVARGLQWKPPVRSASTTNVSISSPGATLDGVSLAANDRILLKNQATASENGIYVWTAPASALTRPSDADTNGELAPGSSVSVTEGTVNADKVFMIISDATIIIGTTAQTWGQLGGGTTYTSGNGISVAGSVISAAAGTGITVTGGGINIDSSVVSRKFSANIGNGSSSSSAVTHGLGTKDVAVSLRQTNNDEAVNTDWVATDTNNVTFTFAVAPASNALRATVVG